MVAYPCPAPGRGKQVLDHQSLGNDQLVVVIQGSPDKPLLPDARDPPRNLACGKRPVPRGLFPAREKVVQPNSEPYGSLPPPAAAVYRDQDREGAQQMGKAGKEPVPLPEGFDHESEVIPLEVPQAPVDQPGGLRGRPGGEIPLLEEGYGEPAQGRVPGHRGARDAAPDDRKVDRALIHRHGTAPSTPREALPPGSRRRRPLPPRRAGKKAARRPRCTG